jgi:hypothetical protein
MATENGILLFAYNNESIKYTELAKLCTLLVKKHLPHCGVTLVTDKNIDEGHPFDDVIIVEAGDSGHRTFRIPNGKTEEVTWHNKTRPHAYDLTPYEKTLLLDVDYLMFNNSLQWLFESDQELICHNNVYDITGKNSFIDDKLLHWSSTPMLWATVLYFTKNNTAKEFFNLVKLVRDNYQYYYNLYNFRSGPYRNDYAISIAYNLLNCNSYFQSPLFTLPSESTLTRVKPDTSVIYEYENKNKIEVSYITNTNIHIMNKHSIINCAKEILDYVFQPVISNQKTHVTYEKNQGT